MDFIINIVIWLIVVDAIPYYFKTDQEFRYLGGYDPGKYGGIAHYKEYDANNQKIKEHKK